MSGPSFRFNLERVRALRERAEDEAKQALAGALQDQLRCERSLQEAADAVTRAQHAQTQATSAPVTPEALIAHQAFLERSERNQRASHEVLHRSRLRVDERRGELTEAARDRQALERLKEHRRAEHAAEMARQETIVLDEIALNGYRRRAA